jgi:hypothetical protein
MPQPGRNRERKCSNQANQVYLRHLRSIFGQKDVMTENALVKKLQLKPGLRVLFLNAPAGYIASLGSLPNGVALAADPAGTLDFVQLFVRDGAELAERAPAALAAIKPDGVLWVAYPKQSAKVKTDLTRDRGWEPLTAAGLRPVTQIAIDATWSALRWRPVERVKSKASG